MAQAHVKLEALIRGLEKSGADPRRLDVLRCTQRFKRSWVELAQLLVALRQDGAYEAWGYDDFHKYCAQELHLRRPTVDKLTMSFSTLQKLAPQVLEYDGVAKELPALSAVDYFGKAIDAANERGGGARENADTIKELRNAVFDEGQSVGELRKRFDPVFHPKPRGAAQLDVISKALGATRRLADLLPEIRGINDSRLSRVETALGGLRQELENLAEPLRAKVEAHKAKKRPRPKKKPPRGSDVN